MLEVEVSIKQEIMSFCSGRNGHREKHTHKLETETGPELHVIREALGIEASLQC